MDLEPLFEFDLPPMIPVKHKTYMVNLAPYYNLAQDKVAKML